MSFEGVVINKLNGGLGGQNPSTDGVCLHVYSILPTNIPEAFIVNIPKELLQVSDAEDLGVDAAFDANNGYMFHYAILEHFRNAPNSKLNIVFVDNDFTYPELFTNGTMLSIIKKAPESKFIGFVGIATSIAAIEAFANAVQAKINEFATDNILIDAVIFQGFGDSAIAVSALPNLRALNARNISISIAQDPAIAAQYEVANYAEIGAVTGMLAQRSVNENLGSVNIQNKPNERKAEKDYPLTYGDRWTSASLSDGKAVNDLSTADKNSLTTKGYIFAGNYEGYAGQFFNGSPTCIELADDYCYIERNRVWNKAARLMRQTLIPEVKSNYQKDPVTGYIKSTTVAYWQTLLLDKLTKTMIAQNEISGASIYINPKQIVTELNPLKVKGNLVVNGIVFKFDFDLGLVNNL